MLQLGHVGIAIFSCPPRRASWSQPNWPPLRARSFHRTCISFEQIQTDTLLTIPNRRVLQCVLSPGTNEKWNVFKLSWIGSQFGEIKLLCIYIWFSATFAAETRRVAVDDRLFRKFLQFFGASCAQPFKHGNRCECIAGSATTLQFDARHIIFFTLIVMLGDGAVGWQCFIRVFFGNFDVFQ